MLGIDLKIKNYKCFNDYIGFESIKPINIVIGKNNIGKSSLVDMVEFFYDNNKYCNECARNENISLNVKKRLENADLNRFRNGTTSWWNRTYHDDMYYADNFLLGKDFSYYYRIIRTGTTKSIEEQKFISESLDSSLLDLDNDIYNKILGGLNKDVKYVRRIYSERNIVSEKDDSDLSKLDGYGNGASNIINKYINRSSLDSSLVQDNLLNELNEIMGEEYNFTNISVQTISDKDELIWEIYLDESEKGRIALSQSGSGLKTVILLLIFTILVPDLEKRNINNYIYILEEMENNLHPSLQRNVIRYIEKLAKQGAIFFITTHSNIFIDSFSDKDMFDIYHLFKKDKMELVKVEQFKDKSSILDDVGFKASDILQSNGVIWVEGPSDRLYINKWIDLWSGGRLKEGKDYQCVFYGGKLLSHLTLDSNVEQLINLLNVNRNSIIIIDSDKNNKNQHINPTKRRIQEECCTNDIMCWITSGREIENYVPESIIEEVFNIKHNDKNVFEKFTDIKVFLNQDNSLLGKNFESNKVGYARQFIEKMTLENLNDLYDLDKQMKLVVERIEQWNK